MSSAAPPDAISASASSNTKRKNKKRNKPKKNIDTSASATTKYADGDGDGDGDGEDDGDGHGHGYDVSSDQQPASSPSLRRNKDNDIDKSKNNILSAADDEPDTPVTESKEGSEDPSGPGSATPPETPHANGHARPPSGNGQPVVSADVPATRTNFSSSSSSSSSPPPPSSSSSAAMHHTNDTSAKLEAMSQEREALRAEVEQLRKQLETIQESHSSEVAGLKTDLDESEAAKTQAEEDYQTLLGRVEKIKETLGDRLKRDRAELEEANQRIEELEAQNEELQKGSSSSEDEIAQLRDELQEANRELTTLRSRSNLSQQNWLKEKDDMLRQVQHFRSELDSSSRAMSEWEAIAMEERQMKDSLADKVADLEEQLESLKEAYDKAAEERDSSSQSIDGLQRALQEIQEARRKELRDLVESSEEQLLEMKERVEEADKRVAEAEAAKETLSKELERTAPFEKEVREKNLLIGKLRHEGIILNDHLTKALRYLKKTKPDEQVDRQIITNYLLQFLSIDRSDPKRFQILQVIAGYLAWTDEQKEQAGLARPGASHSTLRLPASPFHRTPSTPSLHTEFQYSETSSAAGREKESLADLWAGFLERSVEEGRAAETMGSGSRKGSVASSIGTSGTVTKPDGQG